MRPLHLAHSTLGRHAHAIALALLSSALLSARLDAQYVARLRQIDTSRFPTVRAFVHITDANAQPIPDNLPVSIELLEDGRVVANETLSAGWTISTVLTLDVSGSMAGEKIAQAARAASAYVDLAPAPFRIASVVFSDTPMIVADFPSRAALRSQFAALQPGGRTALQDAIGAALDVLRGRSDRKMVLALTDGMENASQRYPGPDGFTALLARAKTEQASISVIGLGGDVDAAYLRRFGTTGGWYLSSPTADDLKAVFQRAISLLNTERVLEYRSGGDPNGLGRKLSVRLKVANSTASDQQQFVAPGVLPHVRGNHAPFVVFIAFLFVAPMAWGEFAHVLSVRRFRNKYGVTVTAASAWRTKRDPNVGSVRGPFAVGDSIVVCPECHAPHLVRSWRLNRCRCMLEHSGAGEYCYHRRAPRWLRRAADAWSGRSVTEGGRRWLCKCAGDMDGY